MQYSRLERNADNHNFAVLIMKYHTFLIAQLLCLTVTLPLLAEEPEKASGISMEPLAQMRIQTARAKFDVDQLGWRDLTADDFSKVNSTDDTWSWKDGVLSCTGQPVSVMRTKKQLTNFELVIEWRHNKPAGNSGVFVWATPESIDKLTNTGTPGLPDGIEVQVLDNAFTDKMKAAGNKTDWFTTHGDVFPVRVIMTPIGKVGPNGVRSFPRQNLSRSHGFWNHYYIRAINGELRLWVNGTEVSGGTNCDPASGYLCLESEGSPIDFRCLRIRELP